MNFMTITPKKDLKQLKQERLAAALRANLRKRKEQARGRALLESSFDPLTEDAGDSMIAHAEVLETSTGPEEA